MGRAQGIDPFIDILGSQRGNNKYKTRTKDVFSGDSEQKTVEALACFGNKNGLAYRRLLLVKYMLSEDASRLLIAPMMNSGAYPEDKSSDQRMALCRDDMDFLVKMKLCLQTEHEGRPVYDATSFKDWHLEYQQAFLLWSDAGHPQPRS